MTRMIARALATAVLCLLSATAAFAKDYYASRYDVRIQVLRGGALQVSETIVFTFDGTFREVFRTIPTRGTDGVEFVAASMDGREMPRGDGAGTVRVRPDSGLRVEWRFAPTTGGSHTFELTYVARGVVRETSDADLLEWRVLPRQHDYRIESSTIEVLAPDAPTVPPRIETRRVQGTADVAVNGTSILARGAAIGRNGSLILSVRLPRHSVLDAPPAWQARDAWQRERLPWWLAGGGVIAMLGLVVLFALRQNYDAPPSDTGLQWDSMIPPDSAAPAIAGTLTANGQPRLEHAMAALVGLAERGVIAIREDRGAFGVRAFNIERLRATAPLAPHEQTALTIIFEGAANEGARTSLGRARRLMTRPRAWRDFKNAVRQEMSEAHLLDEGRRASRRRYRIIALVAFVLGGVAIPVSGILSDRFGPGPFAIPAALWLVALASIIVMSSQTPLSNEGVRRAERWRAFKRHIADPQRIEPRWGAAGNAESRMLPVAIALGLAAAWSKYLKKRNAQTPAWFHAASSLESGHAFAAFIASGGAGAHGHAHGAGGGAAGVAGGGASGAH
jgi:hypothetical protein